MQEIRRPDGHRQVLRLVEELQAGLIYYNDVVCKQPKSADATLAKSRIEELCGTVGDDALRVGSESGRIGRGAALRRCLQAQVETSSLSDYSARRSVISFPTNFRS